MMNIRQAKTLTYSIHRIWFQQTSVSNNTKHCDCTHIIAIQYQIIESSKKTMHKSVYWSISRRVDRLLGSIVNFFHLDYREIYHSLFTWRFELVWFCYLFFISFFIFFTSNETRTNDLCVKILLSICCEWKLNKNQIENPTVDIISCTIAVYFWLCFFLYILFSC